LNNLLLKIVWHPFQRISIFLVSGFTFHCRPYRQSYIQPFGLTPWATRSIQAYFGSNAHIDVCVKASSSFQSTDAYPTMVCMMTRWDWLEGSDPAARTFLTTVTALSTSLDVIDLAGRWLARHSNI